jgi:hypothetical protein
MKRRVTREEYLCDFCGAEQAYSHKCLICHKDICYNCIKQHATEFPHAVHCSGSGDGLYCHTCLQHPDTIKSPLYQAYLAITTLRYEEKAWYLSFEARQTAAEAHLQKVIGKL